MNTSGRRHPTNRRPGARGFSLIECLAYIGLFLVITACATRLFFQSWDDNKALRRNADDIVRALHAGDQWRADLRAATGPVQLKDADGLEQLRIPASGSDILYTYSEREIHRRTGDADHVWLSNVKSSRMQSDSRRNIPAWRWELELQKIRKTTPCRPLFTFETVAGGTPR